MKRATRAGSDPDCLNDDATLNRKGHSIMSLTVEDPGTLAPTPNRPPISAARLNANRRNAKKSTGPVTEAGKARVRMNSWKHGFRAESDLIAADEADAIASRRTEWAGAFPTNPTDGHQRWLVDQLTASSVRIDRCQEQQRHQVRVEADRAVSCWDSDRAADASRLGARLANDPDRVVANLMNSVAGVDWLLIRWRGLADVLQRGQTWTDEQAQLFLDLRQTSPALRDFDLNLFRSLPADELLDVVLEKLDDLQEIRECLSPLDEANRSLAEIGCPPSEPPNLARLRRHETALWRRFRTLEASYKGTLPKPSRNADADADLDADDSPFDRDRHVELDHFDTAPIADLLAGLGLGPLDESSPPPPVSTRPLLVPSPFPRPDRSQSSRSRPSPIGIDRETMTPNETTTPNDDPALPAGSRSTNPATPATLPAEPSLLQNRRARRTAAKKARDAHRRQRS